MVIVKNAIKEFIKMGKFKKLFESIDIDIKELIRKWIINSRVLKKIELDILNDFVKKQHLSNSYKFIERINNEILDLKKGDIKELKLKSFTSIELSKGNSIGDIQWKSNDNSIISIVKPKRGYEIDYNVLGNFQFNAANEKEIIISGRYKVVDIEIINEPFTSGDYKINKYILQEI